MHQSWESQIRTNLEAPEYGTVLDQALSAGPGVLAAGLVNTRYEEGCLRISDGRPPKEPELARLVQLTRGLFPVDPFGALPNGYAAAFAEMLPIEAVSWTTREERLFALRLSDEAVVVISVSSALKLGYSLVVAQDAFRELRALAARDGSVRGFVDLFEGMNDVIGAALLAPRARSFGEVFTRPDGRSQFAFDDAMAGVVAQFFSEEAPRVPVVFQTSDDARLDVLNTQVSSATHTRSWWTVPFDPEHLVFVLADRQAIPQGLVVTIANRATEETVRVWASGLLAWGIDATLEPFPQTQREFLQIVEELRHLHENDLIARLRVGGFANYSMGAGESIQRCQECIYYHPHRKWCDLPELPIPVEAHWWCRLWKL
ncbi:MAG TPA: hypothetical protein VGM06_26295 [Polyangiaceae bacterium]